ncbi:MAG: SpoIIE family protein phosphatase [Thermoguttaceae bacterium]
MAFLRSLTTEYTSEETYPLTGDSLIIGRHPCCEVVLDHGAVSREHARILRESDGFYLEDLHSRNGTSLNGQSLESKKKLYDGDVVRICDVELKVIAENADSELLRHDTGQHHDLSGVILDDSMLDEGIQITSQISLEGEKSVINPANAEMKLRALIEIGRHLGSALDQVLPQLLTNLLKIFPQADCAYILLNDEKTNRLELKAFRHRNPRSQDSFRITRSIIERVVQSKAAILSDDAKNDSRFDPSDSIMNFHICSIMATPIMDSEQRECLGAIQVDTRTSGKKFNYNDLDLLVSVAYQMAVAIENTRLHESAMQERMMERELNIAHHVQRGFLPIVHPKVPGYGFFDYYQPARFLGGDYYDFIPLRDGRIAITLGDVSGKGISAALLMAKLSAEVRYSLLMESTLEQAMIRLNNSFSDSRWDDRFITFLLSVLDPRTNRIEYFNAGHLPPILVRPNDVPIELPNDNGGLPLGVMPGTEYRGCELELGPGESFVILSDGLTDAMNSENRFFSISGIKENLNNFRQSPVDQLGRNLVTAVRSFAGRAPQTDDQSLVIFGRNAE